MRHRIYIGQLVGWVLLAVFQVSAGAAPAQAQVFFVPAGGLGQSSTDNVGIGTANPDARLTVRQGANRSDQGIQLEDASGRLGRLWMDGDGLVLQRGASDGVRILTLDSEGDVGVNTRQPEARLTVQQSSDQSRQGLQVTDASATKFGRLWMDGDRLVLQRGSTDGARSLVIDDEGDVGINTLQPGARLTVQQGSDTSGEGLQIVDASQTRVGRLWMNGDNLTLQRGQRDDLNFMVLDERGFVGIGTDAPGSRLAVKGKITAKEVEVTSEGWADDVFAVDYPLLSLSELQKYIAANGRLPGVPSSEQVAADGVPLGRTVELLLRKVEELTLYVLELEQSLDELHRQSPGEVSGMGADGTEGER